MIARIIRWSIANRVLVLLATLGLTAWGLWRMTINPTYKAYLGVSWLFLVSTVFTLAKTLRDAHEALLARTRRDATAMRDDA